MTKKSRSITAAMARITITTQGIAPCGVAAIFFLPLAGLNFAIHAMVAPGRESPGLCTAPAPDSPFRADHTDRPVLR